jgi:MFS family permease
MEETSKRAALYSWFVLFIAGLGGLLYGIDIGVITAALPYVSKTIDLTVAQTSFIVAAVLGGSMLSSLVAAVLADLFGRRRLMIASGLMFVVSVVIIVLSQGFPVLFLGRLLQGASGGVIAVVVPLYLAECLGPAHRGRGTAAFQFMLTFGIVCAAVIGFFYTRQAESVIAAAAGNAELIRVAENHAWRAMFLAVIYPGLLFFFGAFALSESPRWLLLRGRTQDALAALRRSRSESDAQDELEKMQVIDRKNKPAAGMRAASLLQRKYIVPFVIACVIMTCNQTTGINSILQFLVIILKQAGMSASHATQGDVAVKVINCVMTLVAAALVDRKGRTFLLRIGTAGVIVALLGAGAFFLHLESTRSDVKTQVESAIQGNTISLPLSTLLANAGHASDKPMALSVIYSFGDGDRLATVLSNEGDATLTLAPDATLAHAPLSIRRAFIAPVPGAQSGWLIAACLGLFIAAYSFGPGVVVWLAASELMPTRIRSLGLGFSLVLNQGASTLIAAAFLPVVGNFGYASMFFFWAACTVVYFLTAAFFLPETKGKTLEEIEMIFERGGRKPGLSS